MSSHARGRLDVDAGPRVLLLSGLSRPRPLTALALHAHLAAQHEQHGGQAHAPALQYPLRHTTLPILPPKAGHGL